MIKLTFVYLSISFYAITLSAHELRTWIFETQLRGAMNQRLAVAKRLTQQPSIFQLPPPGEKTTIAEDTLLNQIFRDQPISNRIWPEVILHSEAWSYELDFLLSIKAKAPHPVRIVHLDSPSHRREEVDLIINPSHHLPIIGPNVFRPLGVPSQIDDTVVKLETEKWQARLNWLRRPLIFVAIGGGFDDHPYQPEYADDLALRLKAAAADVNGTLIICTSRRTPKFAVSRLVQGLDGMVYQLFDWNRGAAEDNPFIAAMALADYIVVTGDSLSMMSDTMALGKSFYVHAPPWSLTTESPRMIEDLYLNGFARPFTGRNLKSWTYTPVRVADQIAEQIRKRFCSAELTVND